MAAPFPRLFVSQWPAFLIVWLTEGSRPVLLSWSLGFDVLDERLSLRSRPLITRGTNATPEGEPASRRFPSLCTCVYTLHHNHTCSRPHLSACLSLGLHTPPLVTLLGSFRLSPNGAILTLRSRGDRAVTIVGNPGTWVPSWRANQMKGCCALCKTQTVGLNLRQFS